MSVNLVGVSLCIWVNSENFRGRVSAFPLPLWLPKGKWSFKTLVAIMWVQFLWRGLKLTLTGFNTINQKSLKGKNQAKTANI